MSVIHRVVCRTCGAVFTGHSVSQADGCAAHYARGVVYGHYGSKYDISAIRVPLANITPELLAQTDNGVLDPVCDDCIDVWIAAGGSEIKEWNDFNQPEPVREWEHGGSAVKN